MLRYKFRCYKKHHIYFGHFYAAKVAQIYSSAFLKFQFKRTFNLLILVGGDGGEDSLRKAEGLNSFPSGHRLVGRQFAAKVLPNDVNTRLILVHGVEDDLQV